MGVRYYPVASIIAKQKGNQRYYYVVESARVDGQPRIVHQTYLGTAARLAALVKDRTAPVPLSATLRAFGLPGALWLAAQQTGVLDVLTALWPRPRSGPSPAHYLLLAAIHRICHPGPKTEISEWYRHSVLASLWGFPPERFTSQAFWDCFEALEPETRDAADPVAYRHGGRHSSAGVPLPVSEISALSVSEEERNERYEQAWQNAGIMEFLGSYMDHLGSDQANHLLAEFVRNKIRGTVTDPITAETLCPKDHPIGTKRLCVDSGYYETYNQPHVRLVDLRQHPIATITEQGVDLVDESLAFDAIVFATGFDAMTGAIVGVDITGREVFSDFFLFACSEIRVPQKFG